MIKWFSPKKKEILQRLKIDDLSLKSNQWEVDLGTIWSGLKKSFRSTIEADIIVDVTTIMLLKEASKCRDASYLSCLSGFFLKKNFLNISFPLCMRKNKKINK